MTQKENEYRTAQSLREKNAKARAVPYHTGNGGAPNKNVPSAARRFTDRELYDFYKNLFKR